MITTLLFFYAPFCSVPLIDQLRLTFHLFCLILFLQAAATAE
nr:MAG TPA: hypothetical protein [Caudoviricetes sp.]